MENKKSFLVYSDWKDTFDILPDEIAGKLIKHLFAYVNDENPVSDELIINAVFEPIKATLKRDLLKWEIKTNEKSYNGRLGNLKRYYPDIYEQVKNELITLEKGEELAKVRKYSLGDIVPSLPIANLADSDSVSDSVSDSDNKINNKISFDTFWDLYGKKQGSKTKAEKKWNKLSIQVQEKIIKTLPSFKKSISDFKFLPFPETYLNNERWNDELNIISEIEGETLDQKAYREHVEQLRKMMS